MEYEYPLDQERLEADVDALFERTDKRLFEIYQQFRQLIIEASVIIEGGEYR